MARVDLTVEEMVRLAEGLELLAERDADGDLYSTLFLSLLHRKLQFAARESVALDELAKQQEHRA